MLSVNVRTAVTLCMFGTVGLIRRHGKTKLTVMASSGGPLFTKKLTRRGSVGVCEHMNQEQAAGWLLN